MDIDKNSDGYKVILKFANIILEKNNQPLIANLEEFINIDREFILNKEVAQILHQSLSEEIFKHFDKVKCGYYRVGNRWALNILRSTVKLIGYQINFVRKEVKITIDGENYRKTKHFYTIKTT